MHDAKYIGLDVHQARFSSAVRDSDGKLVIEVILETKAETVLPFIHGLRGCSHVTSRKAPARLCCTPFSSPCHSSLLPVFGALMGISTVTEMVVDKSALCRFVRIADPQPSAPFFYAAPLAHAESALLALLRFSNEGFREHLTQPDILTPRWLC
jgi:hypothetical protein